MAQQAAQSHVGTRSASTPSSRPVVALVSCSKKHVSDLGPTLLSLASHAPAGTRVVLFADAVGRNAASACASHLFQPPALPPLELLPIEALGATLPDYDAKKGPNPKAQGRFACASAKLMLQGAPALRDEPFVLALDVDTLVNEPLWDLWHRWTASMARQQSPEALWGLVQESGADEPLTFGQELRDVRPAAIKREDYFNTGVILIHAAALRRRNLTHPAALLAHLSPAALHGRSKYDDFGLGEQNLLNAWLQDHPGHTATLPCRWNRRIDRRCAEERPGVRHANRLLGKPRDWEATDQRLLGLLRSDAAGPLTPAPAARLPPRPPSRLEAAWPEAACGDAQLRTEWRGNASAARECAYLMAKRWARDDVEPWHRRYRALPCAAAPAASAR